MKIGTIIVSVTMKENRNQIKDSCVNPYKVVERIQTIIKNDQKYADLALKEGMDSQKI